MKLMSSIAPALLLCIASLACLPLAQADDDHVEARRLRDSGEILPLETILSLVRQAYPGKILEVELERERGGIVYEIELLDDKGVVREIIIDAKTGKLLVAEEHN